MIDETTRAAQVHEVAAVIEGAKIGKPKPTKAGRKAMVKSPILPPKPKKVPVAKRKKILCKQLEAIVKEIIFWRDEQMCVQGATDGHRCGNGLMWGHYIAQGQSAWLRYELGNVFVQCGNHNQLDYRGDKSYSTWFADTFGVVAAKALDAERDAHRGKDNRTVIELEAMLAHYDELYQNRFYVSADIPSLVAAGYYGEIVRGALEPEILTGECPKCRTNLDRDYWCPKCSEYRKPALSPARVTERMTVDA